MLVTYVDTRGGTIMISPSRHRKPSQQGVGDTRFTCFKRQLRVCEGSFKPGEISMLVTYIDTRGGTIIIGPSGHGKLSQLGVGGGGGGGGGGGTRFPCFKRQPRVCEGSFESGETSMLVTYIDTRGGTFIISPSRQRKPSQQGVGDTRFPCFKRQLRVCEGSFESGEISMLVTYIDTRGGTIVISPSRHRKPSQQGVGALDSVNLNGNQEFARATSNQVRSQS